MGLIDVEVPELLHKMLPLGKGVLCVASLM